MKAEAHIDRDNWLEVTITAETPEENGRLVSLGMAANSEARKVSYFYADERGIRAIITLRPRRRTDGGWLKPQTIEGVK